MEPDYVDLNTMEIEGQITCPWCRKSRVYLYGAAGQISQQCSKCCNYVLWNFDKKIGYRATVKKVNNL